jgi:hypothetical protein
MVNGAYAQESADFSSDTHNSYIPATNQEKRYINEEKGVSLIIPPNWTGEKFAIGPLVLRIEISTDDNHAANCSLTITASNPISNTQDWIDSKVNSVLMTKSEQSDFITKFSAELGGNVSNYYWTIQKLGNRNSPTIFYSTDGYSQEFNADIYTEGFYSYYVRKNNIVGITCLGGGLTKIAAHGSFERFNSAFQKIVSSVRFDEDVQKEKAQITQEISRLTGIPVNELPQQAQENSFPKSQIKATRKSEWILRFIFTTLGVILISAIICRPKKSNAQDKQESLGLIRFVSRRIIPGYCNGSPLERFIAMNAPTNLYDIGRFIGWIGCIVSLLASVWSIGAEWGILAALIALLLAPITTIIGPFIVWYISDASLLLTVISIVVVGLLVIFVHNMLYIKSLQEFAEHDEKNDSQE